MAFTNTWDTAFPPDTQLANLLGQDIRSGVKVDVQQRMAAISGLDAAKPTFGSDAQPANWNGILFFATDTGKIYQFNNPAWTDITATYVKSNVLYKNNVQVNHTGTLTVDNIYTVSIPVLSANTDLRITWNFHLNGQGAPNTTITLALAGSTICLFILNSSVIAPGGNIRVTTFLVNQNSVSNQIVLNNVLNDGTLVQIQSPSPAAVNTGVITSLTLTAQNGTGTDRQLFDNILVEQL